MSGTLYVVATPIGNLDDITVRAARILKEVDVIACEDTRQTRKLLDHLGISRPLVSYHDYNERERADQLLTELDAGRSVAVVSDAGTPLIADPGYRLVHQARERGIPVSPIPGPSALAAALSASGLPTDAFVFGGFLPAKSGQRKKELEKWKQTQATLLFYETPHRVLEALEDIATVLGDRTVVLGRGIGITPKAPHAATAKLFIDFLLSEEGQNAVAEGGLTAYRDSVKQVAGLHTYQEIVDQVGEKNIIRVPYKVTTDADVKAFVDKWNGLLGK